MLLVLKLADIAPILRRMNLIFKLNGPCLFHCGCVFFSVLVAGVCFSFFCLGRLVFVVFLVLVLAIVVAHSTSPCSSTSRGLQ